MIRNCDKTKLRLPKRSCNVSQVSNHSNSFSLHAHVKIYVLFASREVRIKKNCAGRLAYDRMLRALCKTEAGKQRFYFFFSVSLKGSTCEVVFKKRRSLDRFIPVTLMKESFY